MKNGITDPEQVKPNFSKVKEQWKNILAKYLTSDGSLSPHCTIEVDCPHCGSTKRANSFTLNAFQHHTCVDCKCVYVSPRLNNTVLEELYADEYYSQMYSRSMIPVFDKRKEFIGQNKYSQVMEAVHAIGKSKNERLRVLDIGAGIGEVISVFHDNGHDCEAIEVNVVAIEQLVNLGIKVFNDSFYNYQANEKFDVVMAWGVVEHVTEPAAFLDKVYALLGPSGVFVSEVPHSESVLVDYCQKTGKDPLRILQGEQHIILYSSKAYSELHERSGFKLHHMQTNGLDISTIFSINEEDVNQDIKADIQSSLDDLMRGDLLRGFWFK
jgi:2-polyprenyl-3-methyl-5-hydroxy-6-metoxy-1,4-benzoquinol methylase